MSERNSDWAGGSSFIIYVGLMGLVSRNLEYKGAYLQEDHAATTSIVIILCGLYMFYKCFLKPEWELHRHTVMKVVSLFLLGGFFIGMSVFFNTKPMVFLGFIIFPIAVSVVAKKGTGAQ